MHWSAGDVFSILVQTFLLIKQITNILNQQNLYDRNDCRKEKQEVIFIRQVKT